MCTENKSIKNQLNHQTCKENIKVNSRPKISVEPKFKARPIFEVRPKFGAKPILRPKSEARPTLRPGQVLEYAYMRCPKI